MPNSQTQSGKAVRLNGKIIGYTFDRGKTMIPVKNSQGGRGVFPSAPRTPAPSGDIIDRAIAGHPTLEKINRGLETGVAGTFGITPKDPDNPSTTTYADVLKQLGANLKDFGIHEFHEGPAAPFLLGPEMLKSLFSSGASGTRDVYHGIRSGSPEQIARGGGELLGTASQGVGLLEAPEAASNAARSTARQLVGISDRDIAPAVRSSAEEAAASEAKYQKDLADAKSDYAKKVEQVNKENAGNADTHRAAMSQARQDYMDKVRKIRADKSAEVAEAQKKSVSASKGQAASDTKEAVLQRQRGPVFQRVVGEADKAQKNIQAVDAKIRAYEGAKWNALSREIGNAPVDWTPVQQAVADAERNILQGSPENITIFRNIMKEGQGPLADASVFKGGSLPGSELKEVMRLMNPADRDKFIKQLQAQGISGPSVQSALPSEGAQVDLRTARGFSSELGQKIYGRELPSDVRRALEHVQNAIESQTEQTIKRAGGASAVSRYRQLRASWRDYMEAFYDKDSPLRKMKEAKDPLDKLRPIVGDEGERAISLLSKYRNLGADVTRMGHLRSLYKKIQSLEGSSAKVPERVGAPELPNKARIPKSPETKPTPEPPEIVSKEGEHQPARAKSVAEIRQERIDSAIRGYSHPPARWEFYVPPLLAYKLFIKNLLESKTFQDLLIGNAKE